MIMKLIHCADLHLDSSMRSGLTETQARERRTELLQTFDRMVEYASRVHARGILIAGDLFDTKDIRAAARNTVLEAIAGHPEMAFFYLKGNHDRDNFLDSVKELPGNLLLFGEQWEAYDLGGVTVYGLEITPENRGLIGTLNPEEDCVNIVMLHGMTVDGASLPASGASVPENGASADGAHPDAVIGLNDFRGKNVDYLALGHIHSYQEGRLDARGVWCYPGCLEGRGFDECGEHGFVELTIDTDRRTVTGTFVNAGGRGVHEVKVDISDAATTPEAIAVIASTLNREGIPGADLVRVILTGETDVESERDPAQILAYLKEHYYAARLSDETRYRIDPEQYRYDETLKGEFVRRILSDPKIAEEDRAAVIRLGLQAIAGEELLG